MVTPGRSGAVWSLLAPTCATTRDGFQTDSWERLIINPFENDASDFANYVVQPIAGTDEALIKASWPACPSRFGPRSSTLSLPSPKKAARQLVFLFDLFHRSGRQPKTGLCVREKACRQRLHERTLPSSPLGWLAGCLRQSER
jgi:hypothetical protein